MNKIYKIMLLTIVISLAIISGCIEQPAAITSGIPVDINGGFENGINPWKFYTNSNAVFDIVNTGYNSPRKGQVTFTTVSTNMQLYVENVILTSGKTYRVSFDAYSSSGRNMKVEMLKHVTPYTNYGLSSTVDLTPVWKRYTYTFTPTGFTGTTNDARFRFWFVGMAAAGDKYYFDNVDISDVTPITPITTPLVPTNINLIFALPNNGATQKQGSLEVYANGNYLSTIVTNGSMSKTVTAGTVIRYKVIPEPGYQFKNVFLPNGERFTESEKEVTTMVSQAGTWAFNLEPITVVLPSPTSTPTPTPQPPVTLTPFEQFIKNINVFIKYVMGLFTNK